MKSKFETRIRTFADGPNISPETIESVGRIEKASVLPVEVRQRANDVYYEKYVAALNRKLKKYRGN